MLKLLLLFHRLAFTPAPFFAIMTVTHVYPEYYRSKYMLNTASKLSPDVLWAVKYYYMTAILWLFYYIDLRLVWLIILEKSVDSTILDVPFRKKKIIKCSDPF